MLEIFTAEALTSLLALTFLEIVLGIDNIVFLAVSVARLPADQQGKARQIGLWMAMVMGIIMLFGLALLTHMEMSLFRAFGHDFTIESLVLIAGGLFLLAKGTMEVHHSVEGDARREPGGRQGDLDGRRPGPDRGDQCGLLAGQRDHGGGMTQIVWVMIAAVIRRPSSCCSPPSRWPTSSRRRRRPRSWR